MNTKQILFIIGIAMIGSFAYWRLDQNKKNARGDSADTHLFTNLNFGGLVGDFPIVPTNDYDIGQMRPNHWFSNIYLPANYTGTVSIGTNIIWPTTKP